MALGALAAVVAISKSPLAWAIIALMAVIFSFMLIAWIGLAGLIGLIGMGAGVLIIWKVKGRYTTEIGVALLILGMIVTLGLGNAAITGVVTDLVVDSEGYNVGSSQWVISAKLSGAADTYVYTLAPTDASQGHSPTHEVRLLIQPEPVTWTAPTRDLGNGAQARDFYMWFGLREGEPLPVYLIEHGLGEFSQVVTIITEVDGVETQRDTITLGSRGYADYRNSEEATVGQVRVVFEGFLTTGGAPPYAGGEAVVYTHAGLGPLALQISSLTEVKATIEEWNRINTRAALGHLTIGGQAMMDRLFPELAGEWPYSEYVAWSYIREKGLAPAPYPALPRGSITWLYGEALVENPVYSFFQRPPQGVRMDYTYGEWSGKVDIFIPSVVSGDSLGYPDVTLSATEGWVGQNLPQPKFIRYSTGCTEEGTYGMLTVRVYNEGEAGMVYVSPSSDNGGFTPPSIGRYLGAGAASTFEFQAMPGSVNADSTGTITITAYGEGGLHAEPVSLDWCIKDVLPPGGEDEEATLIVRAINPHNEIITDAGLYVNFELIGQGAQTATVRAGVDLAIYGTNSSAYFAPADTLHITLAEGEVRTIDLSYTAMPDTGNWWDAILDWLLANWFIVLLIIAFIAVLAVVVFLVL